MPFGIPRMWSSFRVHSHSPLRWLNCDFSLAWMWLPASKIHPSELQPFFFFLGRTQVLCLLNHAEFARGLSLGCLYTGDKHPQWKSWGNKQSIKGPDLEEALRGSGQGTGPGCPLVVRHGAKGKWEEFSGHKNKLQKQWPIWNSITSAGRGEHSAVHEITMVGTWPSYLVRQRPWEASLETRRRWNANMNAPALLFRTVSFPCP